MHAFPLPSIVYDISNCFRNKVWVDSPALHFTKVDTCVCLYTKEFSSHDSTERALRSNEPHHVHTKLNQNYCKNLTSRSSHNYQNHVNTDNRGGDGKTRVIFLTAKMCLARNKASCSVNCAVCTIQKMQKTTYTDLFKPLKMYRKTKPATSPLGVVQCRYLTVTWMVMCYEWGSDVVL